MTAVPRDYAFWKRFATAVREDDRRKEASSAASSRPARDLEIQSDWLDQQTRERRRERRRLVLVGIAVLLVIAIIVVACVYLNAHGWYMHGEPFSVP